jgi:hypothetical protein
VRGHWGVHLVVCTFLDFNAKSLGEVGDGEGVVNPN